MDLDIVFILSKIANFIGSEWLSAFMLILCYATMLFLWRIWQVKGIYLYNILAVIIANIQVLKMTSFSGISEPVALGTILFATTFTASDILTEHVSGDEAKQCVKICFVAQLIMTIFMLLTVVFPTQGDIMGHESGTIINPVQYAMFILFAPSVRITIASLISYYISQMVDIYVFKFVSNLTKQKMVWLRFNVASFVSGLVDNIIFSTLAWVVLAPNPVSFKTLVITYIFGTYFARIAVSILSTPAMYLAGICYKK